MLLQPRGRVLPRYSWRRNLFGLRRGVLQNLGQVDLPRVGLLILERKHAPWYVGVRLVLLLFLLVAVALLLALPVLSTLEPRSLLLLLFHLCRLGRGAVHRPPRCVLW